MKTFTLNCHPGMCWRIRAVIHPTRAALRRHRGQINPKGKPHAIEGFFHEWPEAMWKNHIIGEIHLFRQTSQATVIHEAAHAAIWLCCIIKLDLNHTWGNETFAQIVEHIADGTLHGLKMDFRRK